MRTQHKPATSKQSPFDQSATQRTPATEQTGVPLDGLTTRQRAMLNMQRTQGNAAVRRLLGPSPFIEDGYGFRGSEETTPEDFPLVLRDWPTGLSTVTRDKKHSISKVKDELTLSIPDMPAITLTEGQQKVVDQIKANRTSLPAALEKIKQTPYKNDKAAGYIYNGADSANMKPDSSGKGAGDRPAGKRKQDVLAAIHKEIGREGKSSAVNTYDDAVVTLGSGFTRPMLAKVMQNWFARDADAKNAFLDVGVTWANNKARVVNGQTGGIEEEDNALRLIEFEPQILSLFVTMAESDEHGKTLATVQDQVIMGTAGNVPQSVIDDTKWDLNAIRLVAHLIQFRSAKGWNDYVGCSGNIKEVLKVTESLIGTVDAKKGNARVLTTEQTGVLFSFAEGKAKEGLDSQSAAALDATINDGSLSNVILYSAGGNTFFRLTK